MDEEIENQESETTEIGDAEGSEPKATTLVDDTNLATKRMEEATKAAREERLAAEESYAKMKLGGESEAGQAKAPKFSDEEKASRKRIKAVGDATGSAWAKKYE